jgi:hypothetical protein
MEDLTGMAAGDAITSAGGIPEKVGLRNDEILCASNPDTELVGNTFYAAKILTPASAQTKDQAEVIYVRDGEKGWAIPVKSHVATKEEMELGKMVFYHSDAWREEMSADAYRKGSFYLKAISSVDDLFKGMVEVGGNKYYVKHLRIPEQPVE